MAPSSTARPEISKKEIDETHVAIAPFIHRTPVLTNSTINEMAGCSIYFKCENFQKVGAFKARGAVNAVLGLSEQQLMNGLATHSSGNHAQAIAYAAKMKQAKAYIVMPTSAPAVKVAAVKGYGAEVIPCEPTLEARERTLAEVVDRTKAAFIHPYDNYEVIKGQATAAKELMEEISDLEVIMAPIGGGGLLAGTALSAKFYGSNIETVGAEPKGADDAFKSFEKGYIVPSVSPRTIADGLLTSVGERNFPIIQKLVSRIVTVSEEEIIQAMKLLWERMKIIIEPSCAVPLAALLADSQAFKHKKVGVILTGGNVDLKKLPF